MKLVFIIDSKKAIGGGEYAQLKFAERLAENGNDVTVFMGDRNFYSKELEKSRNIKVFYRRTVPRVVKKAGLGKLDRLWSRTYEKAIIVPYVRRLKPDWIIGYLRESAVKAARIGKAEKIKVANFVFETPPWMKEELGKEWDEELKDSTFRKSWEMTKKAYADSDMLIPNSKLAGKKCKEWVPKAKISAPVHPGLEQSRIKLSSGKRNNDIVYLGRLNKLKNIDELLEACKGKDYRIVICGSGEEEDNLKELAKKQKLNVVFTGPISEDEKWDILSKSRLLVFPTGFEGYGMPPMEALARGCQVLCSDIKILKEIYSSKVHYFKLHDVNDLKKKITGILGGKIKPKKVPASFLKSNSWKSSVEKIQRMLR